VVSRHETSPAARRRPASRTATVSRNPITPRPADPVEALAGISSSSPWSPEPDHGLSSGTPVTLGVPVTFATGPFKGRAEEPAAAATRARPAWVTSPWTWASVGGVVVAVVFSTIFVMNRPGPTRAVAARPPVVLPPPQAAQPSTLPATEPPTTVAAATGRTIDLIPSVDLGRDALGGNWRMDGDALISDASHRARLALRYRLPREYDFRIQFTQVDGDNCAVQMFTAGNPCMLVMGGWKRTVTGFQQIAGKSANVNPTGVRDLDWENGRKHTSLIRVRRQVIEAWIDGKLVTSYKTDGSDLANRDWDVKGYPLGLGSEVSSTIFHKVELVEMGTEQASR